MKKILKVTGRVLTVGVALFFAVCIGMAIVHTYNSVKERNEKEAEKQRIENIISSQNAF